MTIQRLLTRIVSFVLLCVLFTQTAFSQTTKTITGRVTDDKGQPVQGATVTVKGSKQAASTGPDGGFTIAVPPTATTLVISSIGFGSQEVTIGSQTALNITLAASSQGLNEVVVVGYGGVRKKDLTGSVASVQAKDFNQGVIAAPDQLLTGKVAGLEVSVNSGQPGAATTVHIRGNNSIRGGTTPLYVIDGVPLDGRFPRPNFSLTGGINGLGTLPDVDPLIYLNPSDIASIDVLKDASAAAIYGSRGANGVILITTKKGATGVKVEANASAGISAGLLKSPDVLSAAQYKSELKVFNQGSDSLASLDPFKSILRTAATQNYNVALSGGNDNGHYRASIYATDQQGVIAKTDLTKYIANFNGQYKFLDKRLTFEFNFTGSNVHEHIQPATTDAGSNGNLISAALNWNPTLHLTNPDGTYNQANPNNQINPLALQAYYNDVSNVSSFLGSIAAAYKILPDLEYKILYGLNYGTGNRENEILGLLKGTGAQPGGTAILAYSTLLSQTLDHTLTYSKQVTPDLNVNAVVGYEYWTTNYSLQNTWAYGFDYNTTQNNRLSIPYYNNMQDANQANLRTSSTVDPSVELQSYFGRVALNYKDRYLITGTFRGDGSSRFGANNKYAYFPSVAAAWTISNEDFMKNNTVFNNLKLRIGYGTTGSQDGIPAGASKQLAQYSGYGGNTTVINYANPNLKWETIKATDAGIDFGILNGRVYGSIDAFIKKTSNPLFLGTLAVPSNGASIWQNLPGYVSNKGLELSLGVALIDRPDLVWNLNVNFEYVRNKFVYPAIGNSPLYLTGAIDGQGVSNTFAEAIANNKPLDVFYLRKFTGFDQNGIATVQSQASSYQGDPNPHVILGVSTDVTYKKFTLGINTHGAFGNLIYNNTLTSVTNLGNIANGKNISKTLIGTKEGLANPVSASTRFLQSGNYMKLGNATISYNLGAFGPVKTARIFFTGSNLFVVTKYTGFDPEVNTDHNNNGIPSLGIDYIGYPSARTLLLGVNFSL